MDKMNTSIAIIADPMGLGKSPQALAVHQVMKKRLAEQGKPIKTLLIVPAFLLVNWRRHIEKFTGSKDINRLFSTDPTETEILSILSSDESHEFNLINYDLIGRTRTVRKGNGETEEIPNAWPNWLSLAKFDLVIVDEAHYGKNAEAERTKAMMLIKASKWVFLTGTPVLNKPAELFPMLNIYRPETFNSHDRFIRQYTKDGRMAKNVEELREILRPIMIRRERSKVDKELEPINRIYEYYEMSARSREIYNKVLLGIYEDLEKGTVVSVTSLLAQITRLKQICTIDKHDRVAKLAIDKYDSADEDDKYKKVIIFTQWVNSAYSIAKRLKPEAVVITGELNLAERMKMVDEFQNNPNVHFLVCSTKAGSEGLDMTAAGTVIFADLMWNSGAHEQAEGRAYGRQNDSHSIDSIYVLLENTIEEWIMELLQIKLEMTREIIDGVEATRDVNVANELIKKLRANIFTIKKELKK
jgi:SNF2 family DNA or RNA helicase